MKKPTTYKQQIEILKGRGMKFQDEQEATQMLKRIGYCHLSLYSFPFEKTFPQRENRTHEYAQGTYFEDVVDLYYFDNDLRGILTTNLTKIEKSFRAYLSDTVSNQYPELQDWFVSPQVVSEEYLKDFKKTVYSSSQIKNSILIKEHHKKYPTDKFAPIWEIMECMTFGNIFHLYRHLLDDKLKLAIATNYGCQNKWVFKNYLKTIKDIRNTCAHGVCLYNIHLYKGIKTFGPAGVLKKDIHNINGAIQVIKYIVGKISNYAKNDLENKIEDLLSINRASNIENILKKCSGLESFNKSLHKKI